MNFEIKIQKVIDKTRVHADSSDRYCQLVFGDDFGVWVSRQQDKSIKVGDDCYLFYLKNSDYPCAVYSVKKTALSDDLEKLIKN